MAGRTRYLVAGLLIALAAIYLIISSMGSSAHYFLTIDELLAMDAADLDRTLTVSGAVLGDTIAYDPAAPQVTFTIVQVPADPREVKQAGGLAAVLRAAVDDPQAPRLEIVYGGVKPDPLQHEVQAILYGQLGADGRFYADEVRLKCPSRYREEIPAQVEAP